MNYMMYKIVAIYFSVLLSGRDSTRLDFIENKELGELDPIGSFEKVFVNFAAQIFGNWPVSDWQCSTWILKIRDFEMKVGERPHGSCSYCCLVKRPKKYIKLYFTNKYIGENMIELKMSNRVGALKAAGVDSKIPTVLYVHGFVEYGLGVNSKKIRDAYLSRPENRNIIIVDWSELCHFPWYSQAAQNTKIVGKILSDFISFYHDTRELSISQLHLIGFSLGAHIVSYVGKNVLSKQKVSRITALDPARPAFTNQDPTQQITKDDADYVDVIHTDGGMLGMSISVGHADFFPNGGTYTQPGCSSSYLAENQLFPIYGICSHFRAVDLYAESVRNPKAFQAYKCVKLKDCKIHKSAFMGFGASKENALGDLYLTTRSESPFGASANNI